jgi:hypothetical protein
MTTLTVICLILAEETQVHALKAEGNVKIAEWPACAPVAHVIVRSF